MIFIIIGNLKSNNRLNRNFYKGLLGDNIKHYACRRF